MNMEILEDSRTYPKIFFWNGLLASEQLSSWLRQNDFNISEELKCLWVSTGGGDFFESETILNPFGAPASGDDVMSINKFHWEKGMPRNYLVFHTGFAGLTAFDMETCSVVLLQNDTYKIKNSYRNLDAWYCGIRREFAYKYGFSTTTDIYRSPSG